MRLLFTTLCSLLFSLSVFAQKKADIPTIYIDKSGVMRWSDTRQEASFYGVNYTMPFAHAYRVVNYIGKNHKEAIDRDVYHFARLGFNAYRIHVWDAEISDAKGNLIENDHLDLLDYLIAELRERNIRVLITTMTNFGNGYPERNQNTGAFSYLYDKCKIHSIEEAIVAQENYINSFVKHVNPYTRLSYKDDPYIVGFEINNEPCHADTPQQTENYINRMLSAIKKAGNNKPVFYNVSHNMGHVQAYFNTAIQGTTYQWYPIGLVAGHTRKGNFLPYVDDYGIPFSNVKGFDTKAKAVYEYDPADITYSYMYPAMTRAFRTQGFQWITQFAYDPIDIAWANTEYQTHFLNLAYTPNKAISMKIAAEVAYRVPMYQKYAKYPNDTVFADFHVSYAQDLSELNSTDKFFYSNNTASSPVMPEQLQSVAGCGSSPIVK
ncbi:MAG: glycoside hydrolase family 5 protein, partial [Prevotella sp.]|nr:glycoside hydrolase family 5 protein [Prevotella sp.]